MQCHRACAAVAILLCVIERDRIGRAFVSACGTLCVRLGIARCNIATDSLRCLLSLALLLRSFAALSCSARLRMNSI